MKFCNELSCYMRNAFSNRYLYGGVKLSLVFLMAGTLQVGAVEYSSGTDLSLNNSDAFLVIKQLLPFRQCVGRRPAWCLTAGRRCDGNPC